MARIVPRTAAAGSAGLEGRVGAAHVVVQAGEDGGRLVGTVAGEVDGLRLRVPQLLADREVGAEAGDGAEVPELDPAGVEARLVLLQLVVGGQVDGEVGGFDGPGGGGVDAE